MLFFILEEIHTAILLQIATCRLGAGYVVPLERDLFKISLHFWY